ncbi:hypothetical protein AAE478_008367 [Parahypoxylon ruwenzoriense]
MKFLIASLLGCLSTAFAADTKVLGSPPARGLSFLQRRALLENESFPVASLSRRDDYTCGPGSQSSAQSPAQLRTFQLTGDQIPAGMELVAVKAAIVDMDRRIVAMDALAIVTLMQSVANTRIPLTKNVRSTLAVRSLAFAGRQKTSVMTSASPTASSIQSRQEVEGLGRPCLKRHDVVIGYWEAWNDRSKCHPGKASDLPIDALTHVNYAFAYLDPQSFKITTMDAATPASTFEDLADLKVMNPNLQIFVSIGGWTFSDNGTATQPVFGNIARSAANRQTFANNLLQFLDSFGYDGVDIDWEYPGAPDRGGSKDDGANYVLMLETLRKTFDASGRKLGVTFTAPSSFWYLRWFDLPGMMKHADWVNLMSYDLHGVWDSSNPIGSIVQGHTNLTEIKLAAELFWRVNIPPSKVALGFGFYGRAFTLADPSCKTPGCPFSGGARPGPCTGTSGYLAHYEIQDILKNKKRDITPVYDKEAAVKYVAWDTDQWISYDDDETFKNKIDWADSVGFDGSLIWASDLDDYELTAHKALTGKTDIGTSLSLKQTQKPIVAEIDASFGSNCYKEPNEFTQMCETGYVKVGADKAGIDCKDTPDDLCGKIICCPKDAGMVNCMWRGSGGDCNGQCHPGEVKITGSSWGGKPGESSPNKKCSRGGKAFCCQTNKFEDLTESCYWTSHCGDSCKSDEESVAHAYDRWGWATVFCNGYHYCCKKDKPIPFRACHWVGKGDCADNTCDKTEVTLWTDGYRKKSLCCKPNADAVKEMTCNIDLCSYDPSLCEDDPDYGMDDGLVKRTYVDPFDGQEYEYLDKRDVFPGKPRPMSYRMGAITVNWLSRMYPETREKLFGGDGASTVTLRGGYNMASTICSATGVRFTKLADLAKTGFHTEHFHEIQMPKWLLKTAYTGQLPGGGVMKAPTLSAANIAAGWNKVYSVSLNKLVETVTDQKDWTFPDTPAQRFGAIVGDFGYRYGLFFVDGPMNGIKGKLFQNFNPMSSINLKNLLTIGINGGTAAEPAITAVSETLQKVRLPAYFPVAYHYILDYGIAPVNALLTKFGTHQTFGVFNYMNDALIAGFVDRTRADQLKEIQNMDQYINELAGMLAVWLEFEPAYYAMAAAKAATFVKFTTNYIMLRLGTGAGLSNDLAQLVWTAGQLSKQVDQLRFQHLG